MTTDPVKSNLNALKKAVAAVTKADKAWLSALETFLETTVGLLSDSQKAEVAGVITGSLPSTQSITPSPTQALLIDQAVRLALDEVSFLQLADRKLGGKIPQVDVTPEGLGIAVKEAEAYLVITDEAFTLLQTISGGISQLKDFSVDLQKTSNPANQARTGLVQQVANLLQVGQGGGVTLPGTEPEGTDLLLGQKASNACSDLFLAQLPAGSKELTETQALLAGRHLTLSSKRVAGLTTSWGKAVKSIVQSPPTSTTSQQGGDQGGVKLDNIATLLCIHDVLETLYDRLEANVTLTDEDALLLLPEA